MTIWTPQLTQGKPIYLAIADAMAGDIMAGKLNVGDKLPPHRDLAWRLKVTVGTVTRAYREAEIRGLLSGEVGRGSYVREITGTTALPARRETTSQLADLSDAAPPPVYSEDEFDAALAHVMREPSRLALLDYMPPEGHAHYRAMGAKWLARSGIEISEANVIVTSGAHLGVMACLSVLAQPGDAVMAESLNYASLGSLIFGLNLKPVPIAMNAAGLDLDDLERACKTGESKILYLVPTLQNPTTITMPRERRDAIVEIARRYNLTIVEDDIFRLLDDRCSRRLSTALRRNAPTTSPASPRHWLPAFASASWQRRRGGRNSCACGNAQQEPASPGLRRRWRAIGWRRISPNT